MKFTEQELINAYTAGQSQAFKDVDKYLEYVKEMRFKETTRASPWDILMVLSGRYDMSIDRIREKPKGGRGKSNIARKYFAFFGYWFTDISLQDAADFLNLNNHATILHHVSHTTDLYSVSKEIKKELFEIKQDLLDSGKKLVYSGIAHYSTIERPDFLFETTNK